MKKTLYFDTSAVVKEFSREIGSDLIDKLTTKAREGIIQIVSSVWAINESIAVIDRKFRKGELNQIEVQTIIATFAERVKSSSETSNFRFAYLDHKIVSESRFLINELHISPDDALHLYTCWSCDCQYFVIHDKKIVSNLKSQEYQDFEIVDLGNEQDRINLESKLEL